ncbi:hypothetical protein WEH80_38015 [Actinomycetes bacterium KLBMP 9759]
MTATLDPAVAGAEACRLVDELGWPVWEAAERVGIPLGDVYRLLAMKHGAEIPRSIERDQTPVDSWSPVDLGPYLRGEVEQPRATIGMGRTDGLRFLYPGKEHAVVGEMESGKSWFCLACVAVELLGGRHVVYVHFEEGDPSGTVERLRLLDVPPEIIRTHFGFVAPERAVSLSALDGLLAPGPSLVVLDGVNEGMSLHKAGIMDPDGAATWRRLLVKPCTRAGAAVLSADHVAKDVEKRGRYGLGTVHKGNGIDGALIMLENADPFGRGMRGRSHVYITKDRPGTLREHGRPVRGVPGKTFMGELVVDDATRGPDFMLRLFAPAAEEEAPTDAAGVALADVVHAVVLGLEGHAVASERDLFARMRQAGNKHREKAVRDAVDDLLADGRMEVVPGPRGAKGYRATAAQDQNGIAS